MVKQLESSFWAGLESGRGLASVPACWRARLGEDYEPFRAAFLTQSSQAAKYCPCPRGCGCMHELVESPNSNIQRPEKFQFSSSNTPSSKVPNSESGASLD